jgi:dihydroneopterin aldolase
MPCRIELSDTEIQIQIGCTPEERNVLQPIRLRLVISNPDKFQASHSDEVGDTLDAAQLRTSLIEVAGSVRVQTLERLGLILETSFRKKFSMPGLTWELTIHKPQFGWTYVQTWSS